MWSIEVRFVSDGRELSVEQFADFVATKVADRLKNEIKQPGTGLPVISQPQPLVVTIHEACRLIGFSRSTVWRMIKDKQLEVVRIGGGTRIRMESIYHLLGEIGPIEIAAERCEAASAGCAEGKRIAGINQRRNFDRR
jgi:excisionase family DNA binding protein